MSSTPWNCTGWRKARSISSSTTGWPSTLTSKKLKWILGVRRRSSQFSSSFLRLGIIQLEFDPLGLPWQLAQLPYQAHQILSRAVGGHDTPSIKYPSSNLRGSK